MKIALMFALMVIVLGVALATGSPATDAVTLIQRRDIHSVVQYRMFAYVTWLYLRENPGYSGTLTWSTLGPALSTPPTMRNASMPSTFKAVVTSPASYVVCGELSEPAATALRQLMPEEIKPFVAGGNKIVLTTDQTIANSEASKCT